MLVSAAAPTRPSAIVSYSHTETGWTPAQAAERLDQVHRLVYALRTVGAIDADADIFHPNEDWTRWGPARVAASDFVLVVASPAWRDAWIGDGDPTRNKGVRAEADAVRSIEQAGRPQFQKRVRLIMLPGSSDADIPVGMHGIARHYVSGFEQSELEELLRDLTDQPKFLKPPLGEVPVFPAAMTTHTPDVARLETGTDGVTPPQPVAVTPVSDPAGRAERVEQLKAQLEALPQPLPGEGPHLPWYRLRQQIESRLWNELREETAPSSNLGSTSTGPEPAVEWTPASNVQVAWAESLGREVGYGASALVVHLIPVPPAAVTQRLLFSLDDIGPRIVRERRLVDDSTGLTRASSGEDIFIESQPTQRVDGVSRGRFLALRISRSGQTSVWYTLPRDSMGSVLDEHHLKHDIQAALGLGAGIIEATHGTAVARVAVAAELVNTTSLTGGTVDELGTRSQATMPGAFRSPPRIDPDESVGVRGLNGPGSWTVAGVVAQLLIRAWSA